jgi:phospholipase/carboxylesterase
MRGCSGLNRAMLQVERIEAPEKGSRRLMVVLHGLGDSMEGYRWMPPAMGLPWMNYLLVNAPDHYYGGFSWYDFTGDAAAGVRRSRRLLIDLLEREEQEGYPSAEMVLFGFSQGCLMAIDVGYRYPRRLAAVVGVSGYVHLPQEMLGELSPVAREQRLLFTHGIHDPLVPIAPVRQQVAELKAAGLQIEWREFAKDHTIAGVEELDLIRQFVCDAYATFPAS